MSKKTDNSVLKDSDYSRDVTKYNKRSNVSTNGKSSSISYSTRKSFNSGSKKVKVSVNIKKEARQGALRKLNGKK